MKDDERGRTRPKPGRQAPPVMARNRLYVTEESAAQVANVQGSTDADQRRKIRVIDSQAPLPDEAPEEPGAASDSDR